jgi:hypothetical protein
VEGGPGFLTTSVPPIVVVSTATLPAAWFRFRIEFRVLGAGVGAACFDVHMTLEKS